MMGAGKISACEGQRFSEIVAAPQPAQDQKKPAAEQKTDPVEENETARTAAIQLRSNIPGIEYREGARRVPRP